MKITKLTLAVLIAILLLTGCYCDAPKTGLIKLSASARSWINYQYVQSLAFKTIDGQTDLLQVIQYKDTIENYVVGDECPDGIKEVIRADITGKALKDTITVELENGRLHVNSGDLGLNTSGIGLAYLIDENVIFPKDQPNNYTFLETVDLAGNSFAQVVKGKCTTCKQETVTEVYLAKGMGLIGFVRNKELWII
jgi:hypothetical protein